MSGLNRAYRDTESPLQPLTRLSVNADFSFNIGGDGSLQPWMEQINLKRGKLHSKPNPEQKQAQAQAQRGAPAPLRRKPNPITVERRVCTHVREARESKNLPLSNHLNLNAAKLKQCFKRSHSLKTNSRMYNVLERVGMNKYWEFFITRGIDFGKFQTLTSEDFESLGIRNHDIICQLIKAVNMARTFY